MTAPVPAIASRSEFGAALRWGFTQATAADARRIVCVDRDFADWPLDDPALLDQITAWLRRPLRKWVLLATSFDEVPRRHPRFVAWRSAWSHAVETWSPADDGVSELPTVMVSDGAVAVELFDAVHWRGRAALDARASRLLRERIDALLQRSQPAFAVNQLGL